jgi:hypothetical protein
MPLKQTAYVLPDSPESREDFEWLRVEIEGSGGEAVILSAEHLGAEAEAALVEDFRRHRQAAYAELAAELQRLNPKSGAQRRPLPARDLARYRERFNAIERIDFFGSVGRDRVVTLLSALESSRGRNGGETISSQTDAGKGYQGRLWVTRPRPGVDRMASAWLIKRFIDTTATFDFLTDAKNAPSNALAFDMYGVGFGHEGDRCTFETLMSRFRIKDAAVARLAEVVHDLDLKDGKFGALEAGTLGAAIDGLQMSCIDDHKLLEQGMILFEAMYRSFGQQVDSARPRSVARAKRGAARGK